MAKYNYNFSGFRQSTPNNLGLEAACLSKVIGRGENQSAEDTPDRHRVLSKEGCLLLRDSTPVPYRSTLERDFALIFVMRKRTLSIRSQPVTLPANRRHQNRQRYTPDYLVFQVGAPPLLAEVHPFRIETSRDRIRRQLAADWIETRGGTYEVWTEREIHGPERDNARLLYPYRDRPIADLDRTRIAVLLQGFESATLLELSETIRAHGGSTIVLLNLLANHKLMFDWKEPLSDHTKIVLAGSERD